MSTVLDQTSALVDTVTEVLERLTRIAESRAGDDHPGHIYFIGAMEGPTRIKVGFSVHPKQRLTNLQVGSPVRLMIAATVPGSIEEEQALNKRLRRHAITGEWYGPEGIQALLRALKEGLISGAPA